VIAKSVGSVWNFLSNQSVLGVLSVFAATVSAFAALVSYQAAQSANAISEASQAFSQKIYNDQIVLGRPSISILSGETSVIEERDNSYMGRTIKRYTATLVLKNSGQRDTQRVWIGLSNAGSNVSATRLPKDTDFTVRFDLASNSDYDLRRTSFYAAVIYEDQVPSETSPTYLSLGATRQSQEPLRVVCSDIAVFKMSAWPKETNGDPTIRTLSSGSPIPVMYNEQTVKSSSYWGSDDEAVIKRLIEAIRNDRACLDKVF